MSNIRSFEISVPESLLEETKTKLRYARLDDGMNNVQWNDLEIGHVAFKEVVEFWRDDYDWRKHERYLNTFNHFRASITVPSFNALDIHFLHHRSSRPDAIPLIFVHGWPGSFLEATKLIPLLTEPPEERQAFHVVAPSIPGYGFSEYSKKSGFGLAHHAECFALLMKELNYEQYVGGDWGSSVVRYMALDHPESVLAIHINMFLALPPVEKKAPEKYARYVANDYSIQEIRNLERTHWFATDERGYQRIQETKPVTLGYALHDSPVGMLAWFVGKLKAWTDDYPWTPEELIHWAFIHYQGSPSAAMQIYKEAQAVLNNDASSMLGRYISQPVGGSLFPKELWLYPRDWVSEACNIRMWKQHSRGGHFIAWERPEQLAADVAEFYSKNGPVFGKLDHVEELYEGGCVKNIGVSNFNSQSIFDIFTYAKVKPCMLQIEHHPYLVQPNLVDFCRDQGIMVTGYSSFSPQSFLELPPTFPTKASQMQSLFEVPLIQQLAAKYGKSPGQVLLRWAVQRGKCVIPKSSSKERMRENLDVLGFELASEELSEIASLDQGLHFNDPGVYLPGRPLRLFA
ncbi:Alpha/Beta hydrolase protein [Boeremia exigua]|uniref:Alpha/Beta hydrolase protein n=1 Tax=Boeremia exigua TaxID=749465 RepID=UPI001E8D3E42|nr:Alpha/Beta hydrolase protein [Boeremia exigua]KAH6638492.1 Alpha/Beta hydrolase protein [Boeremia exigua]